MPELSRKNMAAHFSHSVNVLHTGQLVGQGMHVFIGPSANPALHSWQTVPLVQVLQVLGQAVHAAAAGKKPG